MNNPVSYFEIPVGEMDRAARFYEAVFDCILERSTIDGHSMALFPYDESGVGISGALAQGESYEPGKQGVRIYFKVADIEAVLARALKAGVEILYPITVVGENTRVAEFEDSEGNCIALMSEIAKE